MNGGGKLLSWRNDEFDEWFLGVFEIGMDCYVGRLLWV
jgi:hypothetical protein